jgi:pimeloyl-ACP methyl ester carboxylesterase
MGGLTVHLYVHDYPDDVAGAVLIDSMSAAQFKQPPEGPRPVPNERSGTLPLAGLMARLGVFRLLAEPLGLLSGVPAEQREATLALSTAPRGAQALLDESAGMPYSGREAATVTSFGDLPLIVLSRSPGTSDYEKTWQANQTGLLALSSNSRQLFSEQNDHNIELTEPEAAVAAILEMVDQVR